MKTYTKDGVTFQVFCGCDDPQGGNTDYPREGKWDSQCPKCQYFYFYHPDKGLIMETNNSVNDTEEINEEEETIECDNCGCTCEDTFTTTDGEVCSDCFENYTQCLDCEEFVPIDDTEIYNDGRRLCQSCYDDNYFTCDRCGAIHHQDDYHTVMSGIYGRNEESWCDGCTDDYAYQCDDCGSYFAEDAVTRADNTTLCYRCAESYYSCENCGDLIHENSSYYDEDTDANYCYDCYQGRSSRVIKDYNYKPSPCFHGKGLHLGLELEMECTHREDTASILHRQDEDEEYFYIKSDGSLNNGIEVVTHPCSLEYHQKEFGWEDLLSAAVSEGARSHDTSTCGIHVHLSRKFFTLSEITRFVAFVNVHGDHLKVLARRGASDYARFKHKCNGIKNLVKQEERYEAVNLYNSRTIEVRIFKGTLKLSTLMSCLEVCDAMARFVKTSNIASIIGKSEENWEQFLTYVTNNLEMYSNLHHYMVKKGLIKVVALPPAPLVMLAELPDEIILPWEELYDEAA